MKAPQMNAVDSERILADGLQKVTDVARFLGVSKSTIYNLMAAGELPSIKIGRKSRRIPHRAVIDLAAKSLMVHVPA